MKNDNLDMGSPSLPIKEEWFKADNKIYVKYTYSDSRSRLVQTPYKEIPLLFIDKLKTLISLDYFVPDAREELNAQF